MAEYEAYIDSGFEWMGQIPASWKMVLLSQVVTQVKNKNSELQEQNLLSLSYGRIKRKPIDTSGGLLPESFDCYNIVEANDIVLRLTDLQNDHRSLRVGLATERGIITSAYTTMRPRNQGSAKYLYYLLHTFDIRKGFYGMGSGVRQGLNYDEVKKLKLPMPTLAEQMAIAEYLDRETERIDAIIAETKASIEEYKAWKASIIYEAVTRGLDPNVEMKDSGVDWLPLIPNTWKVERLKEIFTFGKGLPITKADLVAEGVAVVSYGQIHSKTNSGTHLSHHLLRFVPNSYLETNPASLLKKGDIVLADTSEDLEGLGNAVLMDSDDVVFAGYHTIILRSQDATYSKYLSYLFRTDCWRSQLRSNASGIKVFSATQKMLRTCNIILPSEEDMNLITGYLDTECKKIDAIIAEKQSLIIELENYKKSIIYDVITGKRKVV